MGQGSASSTRGVKVTLSIDIQLAGRRESEYKRSDKNFRGQAYITPAQTPLVRTQSHGSCDHKECWEMWSLYVPRRERKLIWRTHFRAFQKDFDRREKREGDKEEC